MSAEENVALVRRYFEEFCNERKLELADELMTADHEYHDPQVPVETGPQATAEAIAVFQEGVGGHWGIEEIQAAGDDRVVVRWTGTGTQNAEVMGIPPTGRPVNVPAVHLFRIEGGKVAEQWVVWDTLGMMQQLGVVPAPDQAGA
ncbi:MAG: ester cyclase [Rubrobacteraceae bacterium]